VNNASFGVYAQVVQSAAYRDDKRATTLQMLPDLLGVIVVTVDTPVQAAELLRGPRANGIQRFVAHEVVVDADAKQIPVGIDGESVMMMTPMRCSIRPRALRVRVPRDRPGVRAPAPQLDRALLLRQALTMHLTARGRDQHDVHLP
jgi:hypothetical protein